MENPFLPTMETYVFLESVLRRDMVILRQEEFVFSKFITTKYINLILGLVFVNLIR